MTVTSVAVSKRGSYLTCDCTVDSDVGNCELSRMLGILHVCGHSNVRSYVSPGMDWLNVSSRLSGLQSTFQLGIVVFVDYL